MKTKSTFFGAIPLAAVMLLCFNLISIDLFGQYSGLQSETDGFKWIRVCQNGKEGAQSPDGSWLIPLSREYSMIVYQNSGGGWFNVFANGFSKKGVCDKNGEEIIAPRFDDVVRHESDGFSYFTVELDGKKGAYDTDGQEIVAPKYKSLIFVHGVFKYENASGNWVSTGIKRDKSQEIENTSVASSINGDGGGEDEAGGNPLASFEENDAEEGIENNPFNESESMFASTENSSVGTIKDDNTNENRSVGGLAMALGGSGLFERNPTYTSSVFTITIESGSFISTSPIFYDWGAGLYFSSSHSNSSYYSYDASSWGLRVPLHIGWNLFGDSDDLHLSVRGGIYSSFLFSKKMNKERIKVEFKDRFGFEGGVRTTFGYKWFSVTAEYFFPFQSGVKGAWMFGITLGN